MDDDQDNFNKILRLVAEHSIEKSSQVLSKLIKQGASIQLKEVALKEIAEVTESATVQNEEAVGAFIELVGDAPFKFLFFVGLSDALIMTDLFLGLENGTTKDFDEITISTIQETANILASAISNVFCVDFAIKMKPEPPVVAQDFSGSLFAEFLGGTMTEDSKVLLIESHFNTAKHKLNCHMYLVPHEGSEAILANKIKNNR
ncbi:MAG: chemotaxis protein CheY-P-specific phosphatase CheC [Candidatus Omnitrophota bacterium]|jgi:chemotaxis protein CheY-P-specific phosphatase CheC